MGKFGEWTSVEDGVPNDGKVYWCYFEDGAQQAFDSWTKPSVHWPWGVKNCKVTHWMELPENPEMKR